MNKVQIGNGVHFPLLPGVEMHNCKGHMQN